MLKEEFCEKVDIAVIEDKGRTNFVGSSVEVIEKFMH